MLKLGKIARILSKKFNFEFNISRKFNADSRFMFNFSGFCAKESNANVLCTCRENVAVSDDDAFLCDGHVFTGNLNCITNDGLRKLLQNGRF